jgi:hypothetical protein
MAGTECTILTLNAFHDLPTYRHLAKYADSGSTMRRASADPSRVQMFRRRSLEALCSVDARLSTP